jgi:hypothetical protein
MRGTLNLSVRKLRAVGVSALAVAALACPSSFTRAAMVANDNASNYAAGGWGNTPPNNGAGFGPWNVAITDGSNPPYVGTYLDSYGNAPNIATSGYTWGTYSNTPDATNANRIDLMRPLTVNPTGYQDPSGLGTLYNQTFSVAMLTGGLGNGNGGPPNSALGFSLETGQGPSATPVLTFEGIGYNSIDASVLIDNDGTNSSTVPVTYAEFNAGIVVSVAVGNNPDGLNPYSITISPALGGAPYYTYSNYTSGPIQQVDLFDANTTGNGYFNSLNVSAESVPEPASIGLLCGAAVMLTARRRKA